MSYSFTRLNRVNQGVDADLKLACEAVIQLCARTATSPMQTFMTSLDTTQNSSTDPANGKGTPTGGRDSKKPLPSRSAALDVEGQFRETLEKEVPGMKRQLALFLSSPPNTSSSPTTSPQESLQPHANPEAGTVAVLLGHIQERVVDAYITFRRAVEFLPAEDAPDQPEGNKASERTFMTPEAVRALIRDLR